MDRQPSPVDTAELFARLDEYRHEGMVQVEGWFDEETAEVMAALLMHQHETGVAGDVAEIGVHHGKSFLLLANGTRPGERAVALDVFGDQEKNLDRSGKGDRDRFEANVAAWAAAVDVVIVQASSLEVTPEGAESVFGRVRLISIDGGHTSTITEHDMRLAEACVVPDGVVVVDDVLNPHWLGVISGVSAYLATDPPLVPFATTSAKLFLAASPEAAERYAAHLRDSASDLLGKSDVEFFGTTIDVYGTGSERRRRAERHEARVRARLERQLQNERERVTRLRSRVRRLRAAAEVPERPPGPLRRLWGVAAQAGNRVRGGP
jgi:hypothetical protein